jgi:hypothetical protein
MAAKQKQETSEVSTYNWGDYQGETGLEHLSQADLGVPILTIIQKGSAEFDEDHEDHEAKKIEGVKVGDIINTVTREILFTSTGNPVKVVPYFYRLVYLEWRPKASGGGIVQTHVNPNILASAKRDPASNKDVLPNGNHIVTTAYFFVRIIQDGKPTQDALLTLTSTQLKKSRVWLNMMKGFTSPNGNTLPMFHRAYYLSTVSESNAKGTWRGWKIEPAPNPLIDTDLIASLIQAVQASHENVGNLIGAQQPPDEDII